jgi:cobalt-zinc-cadmium efflux system outer membrane protein
MKALAKNSGVSLLLITSIALSACSTSVAQRSHNSVAPNNSLTEVEQSLAKNFTSIPLTQENRPAVSNPLALIDSVQLLLSQSPNVRAAIAQLGIADAQQLQAELISNPRISLGAMKPEDGGRWQLETGLSQPLLELFTRPLRRELAQGNLLRAQLQLQAQLQKLIVQTHTYYYSALAAQQHLQVQQQVLEAAKAQQQLALSLYHAGNMAENNFLYYDNELRRVQQQLNKHQQTANEKRLRLFNFIGLASTSALTIPAQLPIPVDEVFSRDELINIAKSHRLDIHIAQQQLLLLDKRRHLLKKENGWRDMSIGINAEREFDGATNIGPELEFALPIFNRGQGKLAVADAQLSRLQAELQQHELDMDLEIAQALNKLKTAQQQLVLLGQSLRVAEKRVALANREVNFMLTNPFQLLEIKRDEIQLAHDYTDELNNYWQARSQLELAIGKALPVSGNVDKKSTEHQEHHHD